MRIAVAAVLLGAMACGGQQVVTRSLGEPSETATADPIAAACGHPGTAVQVPAERRTVKNADCDLTGVTLQHGMGGSVVPRPGVAIAGNFDGPTSSSGIVVTTATNGDVTYDTRGEESYVDVYGYLVLTGGPEGTPEDAVEGMLAFESKDGSNGGDGTRPDGSFALQLYPGTYRISATTPAYNGGKVPCVKELVVGTESLNGVRIECHRK